MSIPMPKKAMVLAAGVGRRLRPYTDDVPKALLPVAGKPLIDWVFDHLEQADIDEVMINISPRALAIQDHLSKRLFPKVHVLIEDEMTGSGGAVKKALPFFGKDPFFILHSNIIWTSKGVTAFKRLTNYFEKDKMDLLSLLVDKSHLPWFKDKGDISIEDSEHRIRRMTHGADTGIINAGIYLAQPRIFDAMSDGAFPLNLVLDEAANRDRLYGLEHQGDWYGVGTTHDYLAINRILSG